MPARKRLGNHGARAGRAHAAVQPPATYRGAIRWKPEMPIGLRRNWTRDAVGGPVTHIEGYRVRCRRRLRSQFSVGLQALFWGTREIRRTVEDAQVVPAPRTFDASGQGPDRRGDDDGARAASGCPVPGSPVPPRREWGPWVATARAPRTPGYRRGWRPKQFRRSRPASRRQARPHSPDQRSRRAQIATSATSPFRQSNARLRKLFGDLRTVTRAARSCGQTPVAERTGPTTGKWATPAPPIGEAGVCEVSLYSGIQTPKKSKPNWLNCGFQTGVSW